MTNIVLGMLLELLLMLLRKHLYLWLLWPKKLNSLLLHRLALEPRAKLPIFILKVDMLSEYLMILECCGSNMASSLSTKNLKWLLCSGIMDEILLPATLASIKILGCSKLDSLCHQTLRNRVLDSHDTSNESTQPQLALHTSIDLKANIFHKIEVDN